MKFVIDQKSFLHILQAISKAVASRTLMPALSGILIEATQSSIVATAYNGELGMKASLPIGTSQRLTVFQAGRVVIPGQHLIEVLRKLPESDVTIESLATQTVRIECEHFQCNFNGLDARVFPGLPDMSHAHRIEISSNVLKEMVKSTAFAASHVETRPFLTGVYLEFRNGELRLTATDSVRLASKSSPLATASSESIAAIVPAKSILELTHTLPSTDAPVSIYVTSTHCMFLLGTLEVYTRILDGTYVDVDRLIPKSHATETVFHTQVFLRSLERAAVFSARNLEVRLIIEKNGIQIRTQSAELGNSIDFVPVADMSGSELTIALNAKNVLEALRTCPTERTIMQFNGPQQSFLMMPENAPSLLHVISPVLTRP